MEEVIEIQLELATAGRTHFYDFLHHVVLEEPVTKEKLQELNGFESQFSLLKPSDFARVAHIADFIGLCDDKHFLNKCFDNPQSVEDISMSERLRGWLKPVPNGDASSDPLYVLPVYNPGETIRGVMKVSVKEPTNVSKITVNLLGQERTSIMVSSKAGDRKATDKEDIIDSTVVVWEPENNNSTILQEGVHKFAFEFPVPDETPSSLVPVLENVREQGMVLYRLRTTVDLGHLLGRGNSVQNCGIWMRTPSPGSVFMAPPVLATKEQTWTISGMLSKGTLHCRVTLVKTLVAPGEAIPVTVEVDNKSGKEITQVLCRIALSAIVTAGRTKQSPKASAVYLADPQTAGPVKNKTSQRFDTELTFDFQNEWTDNFLLPPSNVGFKLVQLEYTVNVKLVPKKSTQHDYQISVPFNVRLRAATKPNSRTPLFNSSYL